jgi:hypothetical protein
LLPSDLAHGHTRLMPSPRANMPRSHACSITSARSMHR